MTDQALDQGDVTVHYENGIATLEFSHPLSNALPTKILSKLADTIEAAGKDSRCAILVLKSAGERAFCAGASFDELISIKDFETGQQFFSGFAKVINVARMCPKFIIGRVQGKAVGGGVGLASAVDYCFATRFASVKLSELAVGIGPFVVGPAIERKIGSSHMSQMAINATKWFTADWAQQQGLYAEVFDKVQDMDDAIATLATTLSKSNPEAMAKLKRVFWQGTENWGELLAERAAMSGQLVLSDFTVKAINRFKKK